LNPGVSSLARRSARGGVGCCSVDNDFSRAARHQRTHQQTAPALL